MDTSYMKSSTNKCPYYVIPMYIRRHLCIEEVSNIFLETHFPEPVLAWVKIKAVKSAGSPMVKR